MIKLLLSVLLIGIFVFGTSTTLKADRYLGIDLKKKEWDCKYNNCMDTMWCCLLDKDPIVTPD